MQTVHSQTFLNNEKYSENNIDGSRPQDMQTQFDRIRKLSKTMMIVQKTDSELQNSINQTRENLLNYIQKECSETHYPKHYTLLNQRPLQNIKTKRVSQNASLFNIPPHNKPILNQQTKSYSVNSNKSFHTNPIPIRKQFSHRSQIMRENPESPPLLQQIYLKNQELQKVSLRCQQLLRSQALLRRENVDLNDQLQKERYNYECLKVSALGSSNQLQGQLKNASIQREEWIRALQRLQTDKLDLEKQLQYFKEKSQNHKNSTSQHFQKIDSPSFRNSNHNLENQYHFDFHIQKQKQMLTKIQQMEEQLHEARHQNRQLKFKIAQYEETQNSEVVESMMNTERKLVKQLENTFESYRETAANEISELYDKIQALTLKLKAKDETLNNQLHLIQKSNSNLRSQIHTLQRENENVLSDLKQEKEKNFGLIEQIEHLQQIVLNIKQRQKYHEEREQKLQQQIQKICENRQYESSKHQTITISKEQDKEETKLIERIAEKQTNKEKMKKDEEKDRYLIEQIQEFEDRIQQLQIENGDLIASHERMKKLLKQKQAETVELIKKNEEQLIIQIKQQQNISHNFQDQFQEYQSALQHQKFLIQSQKQQIVAFQEQISSQNRLILTLQQKIQANCNTNLQSKITQLTHELTHRETIIYQHQHSINQLQDKVRNLQFQISEHLSNLQLAHQELHFLKEEAETHANKYQSQQKQLLDLSVQNRNLQNKLNSLTFSESQTHRQFTELNKRYQQLSQHLNEQQALSISNENESKIKELSVQLNDLQNHNRQMQADLVIERNTINRLLEELKQQDQQIQALRKELYEKAEKILILEREAIEKESYQEHIAKMEGVTHKLEYELNQMNREGHMIRQEKLRLEQQNRQLKSKLQNKEHHLVHVSANMSSLESKNRDFENSIKIKQSIIRDLQEQMSSKIEECERMRKELDTIGAQCRQKFVSFEKIILEKQMKIEECKTQIRASSQRFQKNIKIEIQLQETLKLLQTERDTVINLNRTLQQLQLSYQQHSQNIDQIQRSKNTLSKQNTDLQKTVFLLNEQKQNIQKQLKSKEQRIYSLQQQISQINKQSNIRNHKLQAQLKQLSQKNVQYQNRIKVSVNTSSTYEEKIEKMSQEQSEAINYNRQLLEKAQNYILQLQEHLQNMSRINADLEKQLMDKNQQIKQIKGHLEEADLLRKTIKSQQSQLGLMERENRRVSELENQMGRKIVVLQDQKKTLQQNKGVITNQLEQLQSKNRYITNQLEQFESKNTNLISQLQTLKKQTQNKAKLIQDLQTQISNTDRQIQQLQKTRTSNQGYISQLQGHLHNAQIHISNLDQQFRHVVAENEQFRKLEQQLALLNNNKKELEQKIEGFQTHSEEQKKALQKNQQVQNHKNLLQIEKLSKQNKKQSSQILKLQQDLHQIQEQNKKLTIKIAQIQSHNKKLSMNYTNSHNIEIQQKRYNQTLIAENNQLKTDIGRLREDCDRLFGDCNKLADQRDGLASENERMMREKQEVDAQCSNLKVIESRLKEQKEVLNRNQNELLNKNGQLERQLNLIKITNQKLLSENTKIREDKQKLNIQFQNSQQQMKQLQTKYQILLSENTQLKNSSQLKDNSINQSKSEMLKINAEMATLVAQSQSAQREIKKIIGENQQLQTDNTKLAQDCNTFFADCNKLADECNKLSDECNKLSDECNKLSVECQILNEERNRLKKQNEQLKIDLNQLKYSNEKIITSHKSQLTSLRNENSRLLEQLKQKEQRIYGEKNEERKKGDLLLSEQRQLIREGEQLKSIIQQNRIIVQNLQKDAKIKQQEINKYRNISQSLQNQLYTLRNQLSSLQNQYQNQGNELSLIRIQFTNGQKQFNEVTQLLSQYGQQIQKLNNTIQELNSKLADSEMKINTQNVEIQRKEKAILELSEAMKNIQETLWEEQEKNMKLLSIMQEKQRQIQESQVMRLKVDDLERKLEFEKEEFSRNLKKIQMELIGYQQRQEMFNTEMQSLQKQMSELGLEQFSIGFSNLQTSIDTLQNNIPQTIAKQKQSITHQMLELYPDLYAPKMPQDHKLQQQVITLQQKCSFYEQAINQLNNTIRTLRSAPPKILTSSPKSNRSNNEIDMIEQRYQQVLEELSHTQAYISKLENFLEKASKNPKIPKKQLEEEYEIRRNRRKEIITEYLQGLKNEYKRQILVQISPTEQKSESQLKQISEHFPDLLIDNLSIVINETDQNKLEATRNVLDLVRNREKQYLNKLYEQELFYAQHNTLLKKLLEKSNSDQSDDLKELIRVEEQHIKKQNKNFLEGMRFSH